MRTGKKLGIWMDDSNAHLIEFIPEPIETKNIDPTLLTKYAYNNKNKQLHKEPQQLTAYYNLLADIIKDYQEVILFGPADTKAELMDFLLGDSRFAEIKIDMRRTDKMTSEELHGFVKGYFSRV